MQLEFIPPADCFAEFYLFWKVQHSLTANYSILYVQEPTSYGPLCMQMTFLMLTLTYYPEIV